MHFSHPVSAAREQEVNDTSHQHISTPVSSGLLAAIRVLHETAMRTQDNYADACSVGVKATQICRPALAKSLPHTLSWSLQCRVGEPPPALEPSYKYSVSLAVHHIDILGYRSKQPFSVPDHSPPSRPKISFEIVGSLPPDAYDHHGQPRAPLHRSCHECEDTPLPDFVDLLRKEIAKCLVPDRDRPQELLSLIDAKVKQLMEQSALIRYVDGPVLWINLRHDRDIAYTEKVRLNIDRPTRCGDSGREEHGRLVHSHNSSTTSHRFIRESALDSELIGKDSAYIQSAMMPDTWNKRAGSPSQQSDLQDPAILCHTPSTEFRDLEQSGMSQSQRERSDNTVSSQMHC